jgi:hypothetical protein
VIDYVFADWQKSRYTVSHPQAIVKSVQAKVGELRKSAPATQPEVTPEMAEEFRRKLRGEG